MLKIIRQKMGIYKSFFLKFLRLSMEILRQGRRYAMMEPMKGGVFMKNKLICRLLCLMLLIPGLALTVRADTGPKPSTYIKVHGGGGERVILTLLSEKAEFGPYAAVETGEGVPEDLTADRAAAWSAFADYADEDGFRFVGEIWEFNVDWHYYPPEVFKVAVYYPDNNVLLVSAEAYTRYAFRSNFRLNLPRLSEDAQSGTMEMVLLRDTDWMEDAAELLLRVVLTLAVELAMALLWRYCASGQLRCILRVNLLTQLLLNVLLWLRYYFDGPLEALLWLFAAEAVVLLAESILYLWRLPQRGSWLRTLGYTLTANLASVWLGFVLLP